MSTVHLRLAAGIVAAALVAAACGSSGTPATGSPASSPTGSATPSPTPSPSPSPSPVETVPAYVSDLEAVIAATASAGSGREDYEIGFEGSSAAPDGPLISGSGEFITGSQPKVRIDMDMTAAGLGVIEVVQDGVIYYMRADAFKAFDPQGRWLRVDSTSDHPNVAAFSGTLAQSDPWAALYFLLGVNAPPEELEPGVIDGEPVRHLALQLDFDTAIERAPAEARDYLLVQAEKMRDQNIAPAFEGEVWVDGADILHRVAYRFDLSSLKGGGQMTMRYDLSDLGADIAIEVPAPEDAVDIETLDLGL